MICLDTSAYSNFMRGHPTVVELLLGARSVVLPTVVIGELRYGFRRGSRTAENEAELRSFIRTDVVEVRGVDEVAATHFANLLLDLRRAGTPIPTNDVWIAAVAAASGTTVLTCDAHFRRIDRVGSIIVEV